LHNIANKIVRIIIILTKPILKYKQRVKRGRYSRYRNEWL